MIEKVIFLNHMAVFSHKKQALLEDLAIGMEFKKVLSGQALVVNNETNKYYFIIEGMASCQLTSGNMEFGPLELLNDMFFLDTDDKNAKVVTQSEMTCYIMPDQTFKNLLLKQIKGTQQVIVLSLYP